jgi:hypothetical protein
MIYLTLRRQKEAKNAASRLQLQAYSLLSKYIASQKEGLWQGV